MNPNFITIINASEDDRRDLFLSTANRLGTTIQNIEKDFWVCWVLDLLFNGKQDNEPRLLFKGGTSLSKAYGLISRFSEDIDITVFREDLGIDFDIKNLGELTDNQRNKKLKKIKKACQKYIQDDLKKRLTTQIATAFNANKVKVDITIDIAQDDPDQQTLLIHYPSVINNQQFYVQPSVKIEGGAKSALDPHQPTSIKPYIADDTEFDSFVISNITTIDAERTFWDKIIILHGLRSYFDNNGELQRQGNRVSRHYYDIFKLLQANIGQKAKTNYKLAINCARHAEIFFYRPDHDLHLARPGSFKLAPTTEMISVLKQDYQAMSNMIFGDVPSFSEVTQVIQELEQEIGLSSPS
ncbi:MAG: nucleotidyl transferase AbiEii/AbiGii toxin family protein [Gammaproteobacteria bacterium]